MSFQSPNVKIDTQHEHRPNIEIDGALAIPGLIKIIKDQYNYDVMGDYEGKGRRGIKYKRNDPLNPTPIMNDRGRMDRAWQPWTGDRIIFEHPTDDEYRVKARTLGMFWDRAEHVLTKHYEDNNRLEVYDYPLPILHVKKNFFGAIDIVGTDESYSDFSRRTSKYRQRQDAQLRQLHKRYYDDLHSEEALWSKEGHEQDFSPNFIEQIAYNWLDRDVYSWCAVLLHIFAISPLRDYVSFVWSIPSELQEMWHTQHKVNFIVDSTKFVASVMGATFRGFSNGMVNLVKFTYAQTINVTYYLLYYLIYTPVYHTLLIPAHKYIYMPCVAPIIANGKVYFNDLWVNFFRKPWDNLDPYIRWSIIDFIDSVSETVGDMYESPRDAFHMIIGTTLALPVLLVRFVKYVSIAIRDGLYEFFLKPFSKDNLYLGETYRIWFRRLGNVMKLFGSTRMTAVFGFSAACTFILMLIMNRGRL